MFDLLPPQKWVFFKFFEVPSCSVFCKNWHLDLYRYSRMKRQMSWIRSLCTKDLIYCYCYTTFLPLGVTLQATLHSWLFSFAWAFKGLFQHAFILAFYLLHDYYPWPNECTYLDYMKIIQIYVFSTLTTDLNNRMTDDLNTSEIKVNDRLQKTFDCYIMYIKEIFTGVVTVNKL